MLIPSIHDNSQVLAPFPGKGVGAYCVMGEGAPIYCVVILLKLACKDMLLGDNEI